MARSAAEMPVVTPRLASMDTVKPVLNGEVLSLTIIGRFRLSSFSPVMDRQMRPRPYLAMKLIDFRRNFFSRHGQIAFIFPILVIHQDHHFSGSDIFYRLFY